VWAFLLLAQDVHESLLGVIATVATAPNSEEWQDLRQSGVVSVNWTAPQEGPVTIVLHQLWCFAELDSDGCWLDSSDFGIEQPTDPDLSDSAAFRFGTAGVILVPESEPLDQLREILDRNRWVTVTRYPVAPYLGLRYPRYGSDYEIVGTADEHLVPYAGQGTLDLTTLPPQPTEIIEAVDAPTSPQSS
jgi:hypothetical protein